MRWRANTRVLENGRLVCVDITNRAPKRKGLKQPDRPAKRAAPHQPQRKKDAQESQPGADLAGHETCRKDNRSPDASDEVDGNGSASEGVYWLCHGLFIVEEELWNTRVHARHSLNLRHAIAFHVDVSLQLPGLLAKRVNDEQAVQILIMLQILC